VEISNKELKIGGLLEVPDGSRELEIDEECSFQIKGQVVKSEDRSNQNGSITKRYFFKVSEIVNE
jgi:hypothetical protein